MRLGAAGRAAHLGYCTNIHPGESWPEIRAALMRHLPGVKVRAAPAAPMGVGLRLSADAAATLATEPAALAWLRDFLAAEDLYVFTLNGFPFGRFHGARVKQGAYQPDWRHPERLAYTDRLAGLLDLLLPPGEAGSISTVPGGFRDLAGRPEALEAVAEMLLRHAAHLVALRERTGRTIALALEPEPMCLLETVEEAARFFEEHLFTRRAAARLADLAGLGVAAAEEAARRHLGLCYDVCHAAVEFEDPAASLARLGRSGIGVPKLQLSSALRIPRVDAAAIERLRRFDDGVYLHQVVERRADGRLIRHLDLPDAFAAFAREGAAQAGREWRIHVHVPLFREEAGEFGTTQGILREILALHRDRPVSPHLEVETYTWDVLPAELRDMPIEAAIARELAWVREELAA
jgi:sugar phosphate isomerase/epimerase